MKLKWIRTCDSYGVKSDWVLHYWNKDYKEWLELPCKGVRLDKYKDFCKEESDEL